MGYVFLPTGSCILLTAIVLASRPHASAARRAAGPERSAPKTSPPPKRCLLTLRSVWRMSRCASRFPRQLSTDTYQVAAVRCWQRGEVAPTSAGMGSALLVEGTTTRMPLTHILSDLQTP